MAGEISRVANIAPGEPVPGDNNVDRDINTARTEDRRELIREALANALEEQAAEGVEQRAQSTTVTPATSADPTATITEPDETTTDPTTEPTDPNAAPEIPPTTQPPATEPSTTEPAAPSEEEELEDVNAVDTADLNAQYEFGGRRFRGQELQEAFELADWAKNLDPNMSQAITALLTGQYRLEPINNAPNTPPIQPTAAPATPTGQIPTPTSPTPIPEFNPEAYVDPQLARDVHDQMASLREQLDNLSSTTQLTAEQQRAQAAESTNARYLALIDQGEAAFRAQYGDLTDVEVQQLGQAIAQAQVLPGLIAANGGDVPTGTRVALEQAYWANPVFRDRAVQKQLQEQLDAERTQNDTVRTQRKKASSLSGNGGSVPRQTPSPTAPSARREAMVDELRQAMNNQGQLA